MLLLCLLTGTATMSMAQGTDRADSEDCSITIFRNDGPAMYPISYALTVNGVLYRNVEDKNFIQARLNGCPDTIVVKINREAHLVAMQGSSKHFRKRRPERPAAPAYPVADGRSVGIMIPIHAGGGGKNCKPGWRKYLTMYLIGCNLEP